MDCGISRLLHLFPEVSMGHELPNMVNMSPKWSPLHDRPVSIVTSSMVVNSHLSIHNRFYGFTSCSRTSTTSSIVPAFLRSTSCGMTSARGHGAIVYCLNSGSEYRQTGRHNGKVEPAPH
ncbi:hypothetical protein TNCV_2973561 [Trichonephila clavipes]|nr:hypothetical protein TNCV_2973561 [Trichonephila clavipes]